MQIPSIHLNGTGQQTLLAEIQEALTALRNSEGALKNMTVHDRDYYVQADPTAFIKAYDEHVARVEAIVQIQKDLQEMYVGINDQGRR